MALPHAAGDAPEPQRALRAVAWVRALALALAAAALAWNLAAPPGIAAAALAALAASLYAERVSHARPGGRALRFGAVAAATALSAGATLWLAGLLGSWAWLAAYATPLVLFGALDVLRIAVWIGAPVFLLRFLASRASGFAALEVAVAAGALASSFAPHRAGMVHRPFAIGDFAWGSGIDPAAFYLGMGAVGVLVLAALLLREERARRIPLHAGALLALALLLLFALNITGLPTARPPAGLGLDGDQKAQPQRGRGTRTSTDFQDEYSSDGSDVPVAVVVLHGDYASPTGAYYFRETAFSQFNGRRLVEAQAEGADRDIVRAFPSAKLELAAPSEDTSGRTELAMSIGMLTDHTRPFAMDAPLSFEPAPLKSTFRFQRSYRAVSRVPQLAYKDMLGSEAGDPAWGEALWKLYTEPPSDPRYAELAEEMLAQLVPEYRDDPLGRALIVKQILEETGTYSRKSDHAGAEDPTAHFLFGNRIGYCVHFAHAATYLMRALGVPARVAAGYAVNESDRGDGSAILLRGGNAHAWPEIYLDGIGWVVVDISPEKVLDDPMTPTDLSLQRMLGEMLREQLGEPGTEPILPTKTAVRWLGRALLALLVLAIVAAWCTKLWRSLAPRFVRDAELPRVGYRAALDRLAELGAVRRIGETRERFAERTTPLAPAFAALTREHLRAALGPGASTTPEALRELAWGVRSELHRERPRWRRVLAWLDPVSWLRSR
ncbi:MAG: transglutaminase domain-containing protein [Deltaproteobacteria bacterium]|nr:transglutaminase domain-containing protein [Deltaproteobacteria bacterium]